MSMEGNSPVGGDMGSSVSNGTRSSNRRTSDGAAGPVGMIGATGAVLVCDAVSGDAVVGVVGVSSMGDAALGGMTGAAGVTGGAADATGGMAGAAGGTGGAGGAVMGSDGWDEPPPFGGLVCLLRVPIVWYGATLFLM